MKVLFYFCILSSISFSLHCKGDNEMKQPKIAVLFPGSVEFFMIQRKGMELASNEFGINIVYSDAEWDSGKQLSQLENAITSGVDAILLCSTDNIALLPSIEICKQAEIPLITFTNILGNNPNGEIPGVECFIGINDEYLGWLMGEMAEKLLANTPSNIVLIEGTPGTAPQRLRSIGFNKVVSKHPEWNIIYKQSIPGWTKEGALKAVEASMQLNKKIDLISCQWHSAAAAAAEAVDEADLDYKIHITGLEFSKELAPYIRNGKVDMTTNASIANMGYMTIEAASRILNGEEVEKIISITPEIVNKDNVDSIVAEL